jgi:hypothetical protein
VLISCGARSLPIGPRDETHIVSGSSATRLKERHLGE